MGNLFFVFTIAFLIIIYFFKKDWYIYCALFLYLILPEYCAVSLSSSLPTLTASRAILILLFFTSIFKSFKIDLRLLKKSKLSKYIIICFFTETIVFCAHLNISQHIKEYLGFILENVIFLILFINNINTEEKIENVIKILVYIAGIVSIFSIFETFTGINVAEYLNTGANTGIIAVNYERLKVRRATFSLGHPICLSIFLGMILPCVMYCINKYNYKSYKIILILNIIGIILTISRGPIAIIFFILLIYIANMTRKDKKKYILLVLGAILGMIIVCLISVKVRNMMIGTVNSILKEIGFDVYVSDNFGGNTNGANSRLNQWSALPNVLKKYPLFGGGSYYIFREKVPYTRTNGVIGYLESIDGEYLSVLLNKGIIGFIGIIYLYFGILSKILLNKDEKIRTFKYSLLIALICYVTVCQLTTGRMFWTVLSMIIVQMAVIKNKEEGK